MWSVPPNEPHQWAAAETHRRALDRTRNPGGSSEDFLRQSRTAIRALKGEVGCFDYQVRPDGLSELKWAVNVRLRTGYLIGVVGEPVTIDSPENSRSP